MTGRMQGDGFVHPHPAPGAKPPIVTPAEAGEPVRGCSCGSQRQSLTGQQDLGHTHVCWVLCT